MCKLGGDAMVLLGDIAGAELEPMRRCLRLFAGFSGLKMMVPGNHCLWCGHGEDSLIRYERILPATVAEEGFAMLDHQPARLGPLGLAGSIGWYDYQFADRSLGIPDDFYRAKVAPGAAAYYSEYHDLYERHRHQLTAEQLAVTARWLDGLRVRLGISDEEFTEALCRKLAAQIEDLSRSVERIIVFMHHLPFAELVPQNRPANFAFAAAFMGSPRFGRLLLASPKVTHVYCGHSHWMDERKIGHLTVVNVGSTYTKKRLVVLEV